MSGLCGWAGGSAHSWDIALMARALTRLDASTLHVARNGVGTLAVAAGPGSASLYAEDGVLVALWGSCGMPLATLARTWRSDGVNLCRALSGAFALALIDEHSGEALLVVDRVGTYPLCYQMAGQTLLFGSSSDALAGHPLASTELAPQALYNYLYFHTVPGPSTIYQGQRRLEPGQFLHVQRGKPVLRKYWQLEFREHDDVPLPELKRTFMATMRAAVRNAAGTQRVGAFLSGGTDSSTITAMLGQTGGDQVRTYSIGFDAPGYDEMAYARIAAKHFDTCHHELYVTPEDVVAAIPAVALAFDQPFGNASAIPSFYCAQLARQDGVTRMLGGDGGDELFGGNERYARQALFSRYRTIPSVLRRALIEPLLYRLFEHQNNAFLRKARSYVEQASVDLPARLETYNLLERYGCASVFDPDFLANCNPGAPLAALGDAYRNTDGKSDINQMLALDMKFALADNDLPKVVKTCELAGLEVAFPFLDDALVSFAAKLAPHHKLKGTRLRYFFKLAMRGTLPAAIINKTKHGFGLPFGAWLGQHQQLRQIAFDSLSDLKRRRIVRADFIDDLLCRRLAEHPAYHGTMVWVLMMLEQWFVQHAPSRCHRPTHPRSEYAPGTTDR